MYSKLPKLNNLPAIIECWYVRSRSKGDRWNSSSSYLWQKSYFWLKKVLLRRNVESNCPISQSHECLLCLWLYWRRGKKKIYTYIYIYIHIYKSMNSNGTGELRTCLYLLFFALIFAFQVVGYVSLILRKKRSCNYFK